MGGISLHPRFESQKTISLCGLGFGVRVFGCSYDVRLDASSTGPFDAGASDVQRAIALAHVFFWFLYVTSTKNVIRLVLFVYIR